MAIFLGENVEIHGPRENRTFFGSSKRKMMLFLQSFFSLGCFCRHISMHFINLSLSEMKKPGVKLGVEN